MLFTPDNVTANVARIGAMPGNQKDQLIVRMATEIRTLRIQMKQLYDAYQLTQEAYANMLDQIMRRLDYIEGMAGRSSRREVVREVRYQMPPVMAPAPAREDILNQVDAVMAQASSPQFEDTPSRPIPMVNFEGADQ